VAGRVASPLFTFAAALTIAATGAGGRGNRHAKTSAAIAPATLSIEYYRPLRKNRDFSSLIGPGQLWMIGAYAPTVIDSDTDLDFGGSRVPHGRHILLAPLLSPGRWALVVSSKPLDEYSPRDRIAEEPMQYERGQPPVEEMNISLSDNGGDDGSIEISWGAERLIAHFKPAL
jgi:membrane fusion protein, copper/silver efflux system